MEHQNSWMQVYNKICDACEPDNEYITIPRMHPDCFKNYVTLINFRIELGITTGCLDRILGADDRLY